MPCQLGANNDREKDNGKLVFNGHTDAHVKKLEFLIVIKCNDRDCSRPAMCVITCSALKMAPLLI